MVMVMMTMTTKTTTIWRCIQTGVGAVGPCFVLVEVSVAADTRPTGKVGMSQRPSRTVERVSVSVVTGCENYLNVSRTASLRERQIRHVTPHLFNQFTTSSFS